MKNLPDDSAAEVDSEIARKIGAILDPQVLEDRRLGANLEADLVPEDPDERQYWLWDVDDLETENCE